MPATRPLDRSDRLRGGLSFVIWLWMSLATALVCAVVPAGLPSTRTVGSAFDPSTTAVAVRSKSPVAKAALIRADDDKDKGGGAGTGQGDALLSRAAAPLLASINIAPAPAFLPFAPAFVARATDTALYARPPPLR